MVTQRQVEVLKVLSEFILKKGYSPTSKEIEETMELGRETSATVYLDSLEKLGAITREKEAPDLFIVTEAGFKLLKLME